MNSPMSYRSHQYHDLVIVLITIVACICVMSTVSAKPITRVWLDMDGGVDDYVALLTLAAAHQHTVWTNGVAQTGHPNIPIELVGVSVLDADCIGEPAVLATRRLLGVAGLSSIPVAGPDSTLTPRGRNPFPYDWRTDAYVIAAFPAFRQSHLTMAPLSLETAPHALLHALQDASLQKSPLTLVMVGPLTNLAWALENDENAVVQGTREIIWMGGALCVNGNVSSKRGEGPQMAATMDGSQEWNAFYDPDSFVKVWSSKIKITIVPLDATNKVVVNDAIVERSAKEYSRPLIAAAGTIWSLVMSEKWSSGHDYYAWDVLSAACALNPSLCKTVDDVSVGAVGGQSASQGRTILRDAVPSLQCGAVSSDMGGGDEVVRKVSIVTDISSQSFYDWVFTVLNAPLLTVPAPPPDHTSFVTEDAHGDDSGMSYFNSAHDEL